MYSHVDGVVVGLPFWLFAGLLYTTAVGSSAVFIFWHLPRFSRFLELTAMSRFLLAIAATQFHALALAMTTSPFLNATLIIAGAFAIRAVSEVIAGRQRTAVLAPAG